MSKESIEAAKTALDAHALAYRLEDGAETEGGTKLYHLLASLLEWCDANGEDFDAILSQVRDDFAADAPAREG
jgi:hypothetical protein